jgi:hypothetical protein
LEQAGFLDGLYRMFLYGDRFVRVIFLSHDRPP